jgi:hypothetical protein
MKPDVKLSKVVVSAHRLPNTLAKNDYILYNGVSIIGNWMYFEAEVWRMNQSAHPYYINSSYNRINLNGTNLQTLDSIRIMG